MRLYRGKDPKTNERLAKLSLALGIGFILLFFYLSFKGA